MAILTPVSEAQATAFLADYEGMGPLRAVVGIPLGTVNSSFALDLDRPGGQKGARWFLRVYEEQDRAGALAEADLLAGLSDRGVSTPAPLRRRDGGLVGELSGKPAALFPWRDGQMRCLAGVTPADAHKVGRALASIHLAGSGAPLRAGRFRPEDLRVRLDRIARCPEPSLSALAAPLRARLDAIVATRDPSLPTGLVHGDLFRDNVLWGVGPDAEIAALLDFESACEGTFAFDLMVTVLAWCFRETLEPALARAMAAGYVAVRPLAKAEVAGLSAEGRLAALRFTITRITDDAMRAIELGVAPRRDKDWRRFAARGAELDRFGPAGLEELLGLA
jgi:homoserine kinase type II